MTLRKQRGFKFEYHIVNLLRERGFKASKSGGNTVGFPDIIATRHYTLLAIEAKSVAGFHAYIPLDQIQRCFHLLEMFEIYKNKHTIAAFKFMTKITGNSFRRPIKYYYFCMDEYQHRLTGVNSLKCTYNGELSFLMVNEKDSFRVKMPQVTFNKDDIFFDYKWMTQKKLTI